MLTALVSHSPRVQLLPGGSFASVVLHLLVLAQTQNRWMFVRSFVFAV